MIAIRKVCVNANAIQNANMYNQQAAMSGDQWQQMPIPPPRYMNARFSFSPRQVMDWFIDPESKERDIIVFLQHRGELRFEYDPLLETTLDTIFSVI